MTGKKLSHLQAVGRRFRKDPKPDIRMVQYLVGRSMGKSTTIGELNFLMSTIVVKSVKDIENLLSKYYRITRADIVHNDLNQITIKLGPQSKGKFYQSDIQRWLPLTWDVKIEYQDHKWLKGRKKYDFRFEETPFIKAEEKTQNRPYT